MRFHVIFLYSLMSADRNTIYRSTYLRMNGMYVEHSNRYCALTIICKRAYSVPTYILELLIEFFDTYLHELLVNRKNVFFLYLSRDLTRSLLWKTK